MDAAGWSIIREFVVEPTNSTQPKGVVQLAKVRDLSGRDYPFC